MPITADSTTSHVPADAITLAAVMVRRTEHESIVLTAYFSNKSVSIWRISSPFMIACISFGGSTDPCRDSWKHELPGPIERNPSNMCEPSGGNNEITLSM